MSSRTHLSWVRTPQSEAGSALVIAILVLFVLSVLGLAITLMASVESDLSANYRWSEMAYFNAEAGLEYGKNVLAGYASTQGDFRQVLPPARGAAQMAQPPEALTCQPQNPGCRDYQYSLQNGNTVVYIGRVLRDQSARLLQFDFRRPGQQNDLGGGDLNGDGSADLPGTITLWVRRPIRDGVDVGQNNQAVLTSEGTAPNYESPQTGRAGALHRLEMTIALGTAGGRPLNKYKTRNETTDGSDTSNLTQQRSLTEQ